MTTSSDSMRIDVKLINAGDITANPMSTEAEIIKEPKTEFSIFRTSSMSCFPAKYGICLSNVSTVPSDTIGLYDIISISVIQTPKLSGPRYRARMNVNRNPNGLERMTAARKYVIVLNTSKDCDLRILEVLLYSLG